MLKSKIATVKDEHRLVVIILTKNEELHIERAIRSIQEIATEIIVVDSGSEDETVRIAEGLKARVFTHPFTTQARQFNWALSKVSSDCTWIFRLDADEIVTPELRRSIQATLPHLGPNVAGATVKRRLSFLGRKIRWGGISPVKIVRIFRYGRGQSDDRWMDEHIQLDGPAAELSGELVDDNLKPLGWWIEKHNGYASREVIEILRRKHLIFGHRPLKAEQQNITFFKRKIYAQFPIGIRPLLYFLYRFVFRLGFLDGPEGRSFHFLQAFWYRYLVDMKLRQVELTMSKEGIGIKAAIEKSLDVRLQEFQ